MIWLLVGVAGGYAALLVSLALGQRHILFRPNQAAPLHSMVGVPSLGPTVLTTQDGLRLLAWQLPAVGAAPVILYLHGNAGHIGHRGERVRAMAGRGWGALLVSYRGYGGNPGSPSEAGLLADAEAGLAWLRQDGVDPARIVLWGESLGSGVAVQLAVRHAVGAVVLETPFTSIAAIAWQRYKFVPVDWLLKDRFDSLGRIAGVTAPILVAIGGRDRVVPPAMSRELHAAIAAPAELWVAAEAGHTDLMQHGLADAISGFLDRHLPPR